VSDGLTRPTTGRFNEKVMGEEAARQRVAEREYDHATIARYLPWTQYAMAEMTPGDWLRVAYVARAINSYTGFAGPLSAPIRMFYGCLATDLYAEASTRGEPLPEPTEAEIADFHDRISRVLAESARRRAFGERGLDRPTNGTRVGSRTHGGTRGPADV